MKKFVVCVMIMMSVVTNAQTLSLRDGRNFTPADHLSLAMNTALDQRFNKSYSRWLHRKKPQKQFELFRLWH